MKGIIQGVTTRKKDDGKISSMLYLTGVKFSNYDQTADVCKGSKVEAVYIPMAVECNVGDTAVIEYGKSASGMAIFEDLTIIPKEKK